MRLTVKGILSLAGIAVLIGATLLLSQCNPSIVTSPSTKDEEQHPRRQPLMMDKQVISVNEQNNDEYLNSGQKSSARESDINALERLSQEENDFSQLSEIPCNINEETTISCRRDESDVYIPFSFIHSYFEVYGQVSEEASAGPVFHWSHSNSRVYEPSEPYNPYSPYLNFEFFNVEARDRVKCISALEGVPISTQWLPSGYTYPTQIAQFGLSHHSKYLKETKPPRIILEDGNKKTSKWRLEHSTSSLQRLYDKELSTTIVSFAAPVSLSQPGISVDISGMDTSNLLVLSLYLRMPCNVNSSLTVSLQTKDKKPQIYQLHYICSNMLLQVQNRHIFYGIGDKTNWSRFTRNILVDFMKGVSASTQSKKMRKHLVKTKIYLLSIEFRGEGMFTNLKLSKTEHLNHVYDAADWLLHHQDAKGGWAVSVPRKMVAGVMEAPAGWYSAMAQGQAISLFVRAAHLSGDHRYLQAAAKATKLFAVNTTDGGVRTYFPGGLVWYEEYPTTPSSYVLNGFMYSLFGLYDLMQAKEAPRSGSKQLFEDGMRSLKKLLPFYDSGSGSFYDLRHFTTHLPPKIARWDYHTTHITQLMFLASINDQPDGNLLTTAERWKEYTLGRRASHN